MARRMASTLAITSAKHSTTTTNTAATTMQRRGRLGRGNTSNHNDASITTKKNYINLTSNFDGHSATKLTLRSRSIDSYFPRRIAVCAAPPPCTAEPLEEVPSTKEEASLSSLMAPKGSPSTCCELLSLSSQSSSSQLDAIAKLPRKNNDAEDDKENQSPILGTMNSASLLNATTAFKREPLSPLDSKCNRIVTRTSPFIKAQTQSACCVNSTRGYSVSEPIQVDEDIDSALVDSDNINCCRVVDDDDVLIVRTFPPTFRKRRKFPRGMQVEENDGHDNGTYRGHVAVDSPLRVAPHATTVPVALSHNGPDPRHDEYESSGMSAADETQQTITIVNGVFSPLNRALGSNLPTKNQVKAMFPRNDSIDLNVIPTSMVVPSINNNGQDRGVVPLGAALSMETGTTEGIHVSIKGGSTSQPPPLRKSSRLHAKTNNPSVVGIAAPANEHLKRCQNKQSRLPVVGDRCRVYYKAVSDFWSTTTLLQQSAMGRRARKHKKGATPREGAGGWYVGTVESAADKAGFYGIVFDNGERTTSSYYPGLLPKPDGHDDDDDKSIGLDLLEHGEGEGWVSTRSGEIAYQERPKELRIGDLVMAKFQNKSNWHRGRVCAVGRDWIRNSYAQLSEPTQQNGVSVAYDDGDLESDIPIGKQFDYVRFVESGFDNLQWMVGLPVTLTSRKDPTVNIGMVIHADHNRGIMIRYQHFNGCVLANECRAYKDVVKALFDSAVSMIVANRVFVFPQAVVMMTQRPSCQSKNCNNETKERPRSEDGVSSESSPRRSRRNDRLHCDHSNSSTPKTPPVMKEGEQASVSTSVKASLPSGNSAGQEASLTLDVVSEGKLQGAVNRSTQMTTRSREAAKRATAMPEESLVSTGAGTLSRSNNGLHERPVVRAHRTTRSTALKHESSMETTGTMETKPTSASKPLKSEQLHSKSEVSRPTVLQGCKTVEQQPVRGKKRTTQINVESKPSKKGRSQELLFVESDGEAWECDDVWDKDETTIASSSLKMPTSCKSDILENAIKSVDADVGASLIEFCVIHHNFLPSRGLATTLINIVTFGPHHGKEAFADSKRMDMVLRSIKLLLSEQKSATIMMERIDNNYWSTVFEQLTKPYYTHEGDEFRNADAASKRMTDSVHAKACCADFFSQVMDRILRGAVKQKDMAVAATSGMANPLICDILSHRRGSSKAFELAVKTSMNLMLRYGHFLDADWVNPGLAMQTERLFDCLGKTVSYMAWLYGHDMHEDFKGLASTMNMWIRHEVHAFLETTNKIHVDALRNSRQGQEGGDDDKKSHDPVDSYLDLMMIKFVSTLDKRIVPNVCPALAKLLEVDHMSFCLLFGIPACIDDKD